MFLYFTENLPCPGQGLREEGGDGQAGEERRVEAEVIEAAIWKTAHFWCYMKQRGARDQHVLLWSIPIHHTEGY